MLPPEINEIEEGGFISAEHYNKIVRTCNALLKGEGRNGIKVSFAEAGIVWKGSGTGSASDGTAGSGSAVAFRGHWNTLTTYDEGDVVFVAGAADQAELKAHTFVSLQGSNLNNTPPDTITAYEDAWWRVVSIGSWPTLAVGNPNIAPTDERLVTLAPGAGLFHLSGSAQNGNADNDYTEIVGGQISSSVVYVNYGPVEIVFPDGTNLQFSYNDVSGSNLGGREWKLREEEICEDGLVRYKGFFCTETYDH